MQDLAARYPELFREVVWPWGPTRANFELRAEPPPGELIANVNVVAYTGHRWVIIRVGDEWDIIGGTLEPGEGYLEAIRREAMEEAGAHLLSFKVFGAWECRALGQPYRPHLPHPSFYRIVGLGEVELRAAPKNPAGGENVTAVEAVALETAVARLAAGGRPHHRALAELYQLASQIPPS